MGIEKVVIIGSGCAGFTAAIYASRLDLEPLVLSGLMPGGQLMLTTEVENFPGFKDPILGPDLMETMKQQCIRLGVRFINEEVAQTDFKTRPFKFKLDSGGSVEAKAVIIATGANARWLGLPSEQKLRGKGVSACAVCDGPFYKGRNIVLVGGGDAAMEEACFLTRFAAGVTVIHRRDKLRASSSMQNKAMKNPKIKFAWNSVVEEVLGDLQVTGVRIKDVKENKTFDLDCGGLFVAIGHDPATKVFAGQIELDPKGYIITKGGPVHTSVEGVFAAGDCVDHRYRQAVVAAGFGSMAALETGWYLEKNDEAMKR
ncbi:thioredoxin-disulfide reductase [Elusimicrobiota bacterium]